MHKLSDTEKQNHVLIVQDTFTSFYDADVIEKLIVFIKKMGKTPVLLPFSPNGKPQHVKGFLDKFTATATTTASFLTNLAKLNIPMIGADASLVLCYRDEYLKLLGTAKTQYTVLTITEWLSNSISDIKQISRNKTGAHKLTGFRYKLLAHCSEKTALPETEQTWQNVYKALGLDLDITPVGCCGMAGTYGHESEHFDNSKGIYELSWANATNTQKNEQIVVTGYSCRSQVKRFEQQRPKHPIEVLADLLD